MSTTSRPTPVALHNPETLHDPVRFGYSHAATAGQLAYIGGQYGSDATGAVVSDHFDAQVERAFANLGAALNAAGSDYQQVLRLGTYIVGHDSDKLEILLGHIRRIWGDRPPAQTLIGVASLALPGMLFEVDAVATLGHGLGDMAG